MNTTKEERIEKLTKSFCRIYRVEYSEAVLKHVLGDDRRKAFDNCLKLSYWERAAINEAIKAFFQIENN